MKKIIKEVEKKEKKVKKVIKKENKLAPEVYEVSREVVNNGNAYILVHMNDGSTETRVI